MAAETGLSAWLAWKVEVDGCLSKVVPEGRGRAGRVTCHGRDDGT